MSLEDEIESLGELDRFRIRSAELRDSGLTALAGQLNSSVWIAKDDPLEDACHAKALLFPGAKQPPPDSLISRLENLDLAAIVGDPQDFPRRTVLRSAKMMQALVSAPQSAFNKPTLLLYYILVRELYTADAPDWTLGGSRAEAPGKASAYVTSECIRSILGFSRALANTAKFLHGIRTIFELGPPCATRFPQKAPEAWESIQQERLSLGLFVTVRSLVGNLALRLTPPSKEFGAAFLSFVESVPEIVAQEVVDALANFESALQDLKSYRAEEEANSGASPEARNAFHRSYMGHWTALGAIEQAVERAKEAQKLLKTADPRERLGKLAEKFTEVSEQVRKVLHPAKRFAEHALQAELATTSTTEPWDFAELAFAVSRITQFSPLPIT